LINTSINTIKKKAIGGLLMGHLNIQSLFNKSIDLHNLLLQYSFDLFSLNETWLKTHMNNSCLYLDGYKIFRLDRMVKKGGGVAILVKNSYNASIENTLLTDNVELLHVSLQLPASKAINIISVYKPPHVSVGNFLSDMGTLLSSINYNSFPLIIVGDININALNSSDSNFIFFNAFFT
jgi:exonuclease III